MQKKDLLNNIKRKLQPELNNAKLARQVEKERSKNMHTDYEPRNLQ